MVEGRWSVFSLRVGVQQKAEIARAVIDGKVAPQEDGGAQAERGGVDGGVAILQVIDLVGDRFIKRDIPSGFLKIPWSICIELRHVERPAPVFFGVFDRPAHGTTAVALDAEHVDIGSEFEDCRDRFRLGVDHGQAGEVEWKAFVYLLRHAVDDAEVGFVQVDFVAEAPHQDGRVVADGFDFADQVPDHLVCAFVVVEVPGAALFCWVLAMIGHPFADDHFHSQALGVIEFLAHDFRAFDGVAPHGIDAARCQAVHIIVSADALDLKRFKAFEALAARFRHLRGDCE